MQRRLLAAVVVVLAVLASVALLLGTRDRPAPDGADAPQHAAVRTEHDESTTLAAPAEPVRVEVDRAGAHVAPAVASTSGPWTGVRVRVLAREDGRPVRGAQVRARVPGGSLSWTVVEDRRAVLGEAVRTGFDGVAELVLEPATKYTINAHLFDGLGGTSIALEPLLTEHQVRSITIDLATQPDRVVHGRVIDRETGAPIAGARVGRTIAWREIDPESEERTDADGRFRVEAWSFQSGTASVLADGYEYAWTPLAKGHETPDAAVEIAISRGATVRLRVLDARGAPIAGAQATLWTSMHRFGRGDGLQLRASGWPDASRFEATADARGLAVFVDLPPRMPLEGEAGTGRAEPFRATELITLEPGEVRELEWRIGAGCTVRGVARESDGAPAVGVTVWLVEARHPRPIVFEPSGGARARIAVTGPDGRFAFDDVAPGDWWLGPAPDPFADHREPGTADVAPHARVVTVGAGAAHVDVELRIGRGLWIAGRVLDGKGEAPLGAFVHYVRRSDGLVGDATSVRTGGAFRVGPVDEGEYELRASAFGRATSLPVRARPGERDVELRLRAGASIRGVVVDARSGEPVDAEIRLRARDFGVRAAPPTDADGRFTFAGLDPGLHDVVASTSTGQIGLVRDVHVAEGETRDVRVEVAPGARVRVRFDGPWSVGGVAVHVDDVTLASEEIERGTERSFFVPAGASIFRVRATGGGPDLDVAITTKPGETRDLVFDGAWK